MGHLRSTKLHWTFSGPASDTACMTVFDRGVLALVLVAAFSLVCRAQQSAQLPSAPVPQNQSSQTEQEIQKQEQSQRVLRVVPMFGVTSRQKAPPLTPGQKFHLMIKESLDPFQYVAVGLEAGLEQAANEFPAYGQGAAGYGKRYGATLADEVSGEFFGSFFYPVLFKQDPRYFRLGEGSVKHRIGYALTQEFVCHNDEGGRSFNWSAALGAVTAGGVSNAYYPSTDRGFGLTMNRAAIAVAYGSIGSIFDEFWPDIERKVFHKKQATPTPRKD